MQKRKAGAATDCFLRCFGGFSSVCMGALKLELEHLDRSGAHLQAGLLGAGCVVCLVRWQIASKLCVQFFFSTKPGTREVVELPANLSRVSVERDIHALIYRERFLSATDEHRAHLDGCQESILPYGIQLRSTTSALGAPSAKQLISVATSTFLNGYQRKKRDEIAHMKKIASECVPQSDFKKQTKFS